ncbi:MAG: AAA family ATPase [Anaerolineales bacterium]
MNEAFTIAIANLRAGVGKTSLTLSLGTTLAERGHRVLLLDLDPQGSLTVACGVEDAADANLAQVMGNTIPGRVPLWDIMKEIVPGNYIFLAPADISLAHSEYGLMARMGREFVLSNALENVDSNFDYILLDCPSSLGLLTLNGLTAAHTILMPTQPHLAHMRGLWLFLGTMERIKRELNPELSLLGVLLTYFNPTLPHHQTVLSTMRAGGLPILPVALDRRDGEHEELPSAGTTTYVPGSYHALEQLSRLVEEARASGVGTGPLGSAREQRRLRSQAAHSGD